MVPGHSQKLLEDVLRNQQNLLQQFEDAASALTICGAGVVGGVDTTAVVAAA